MGGACGNLKKNMPTNKGKPKKVIIKGRQITVSKGLNNDPTSDYKGLVGTDWPALQEPGHLDFDAHVGVMFMK